MPSSRILTLVTLTAIALLATGCVSVRPGPASSSPVDSEPSESAPADDALGIPDEFTFEAGDGLSPDVRVEWGDTLFAKDGFTLSHPDDGNGSWGYTEDATQCTVLFWQGSFTGAESATNDRELSDAVLATWLHASAEDVTSYAEDGVVGYQVGGTGSADVRVIAGTTAAGEATISAARGVLAIDGGFIVDVSCPAGQDAGAAYAALAAEDLVLVVGPAY
ncbi:MAG: hypothetical protein DI566_06190 [Microbacterium sp.]|nr:MAG: hypothetical protein DI566_06190 [Microbacterium sp.]